MSSASTQNNIIALIADDDKATRECFAIFLKNAGLLVLHASTGKEALKIAVDEQPDIILMDSMFQDDNGLECLKTLRASEESKNIPVIICSGDSRREHIIQCAKAGADEFLIKPVEMQTLLEKMVLILNRRANINDGTNNNNK